VKRALNMIGIITLAVLIGFSIIACGEPGGGGGTTACTQHAWGAWENITKQPTCIATGTGTRTCTSCGTTDTTIPIVPSAHDWSEWEGENPPTCIEPSTGLVTRECLRSGCNGTDQSNEPLEPIGHDESGTAASCTTAKFCARMNCNHIITIALEHEFDWEETRTGVEIETCQNVGCEETRGDIRLTLELGQTGPGGGIIFYVDPTGFTVQGYSGGINETAYLNFSSYTAYYLEAALSDFSDSSFHWASDTFFRWASDTFLPIYPDGDVYDFDGWLNIMGTETSIGEGRKNTALILSLDPLAPSAKLCFDYNYNNLNDWFLPSKDELDELYINKSYINNIAIGINTYYFSSSQVDDFPADGEFSCAWGIQFTEEYDFPFIRMWKSNFNRVRAVRAF